jgi:hypothetical protein
MAANMNIEAYRTLKPHHNTVDKMIVTNPLTKNIAHQPLNLRSPIDIAIFNRKFTIKIKKKMDGC